MFVCALAFILFVHVKLATPVIQVKTKQPCPKSLTVDITDGDINSEYTIVKNNLSYSVENYFFLNGIVHGCVCNILPCVRKCCELSQKMTNGKCFNSTNDFSYDVYNGTSLAQKNLSNFYVIHNNSYCKSGRFRLYPNYSDPMGDNFYVQPNGRLYGPYVDETRQWFGPEEYCLETFSDDGEDDMPSALLCFLDPEELPGSTSLGMIISMPFLLATFIAYALLPDRNLHMKALMMYVINLMLGYLLLVIIQLSDTRFSDDVCMSMGYFCLFFFLVSFFWMNVICIDIWFTFSGLRGFSGSKKSAERKRFLMYCAYAWGMPVLHVSIVRIIEATTSQTSLFKPGIGDGQCFLKRGYPELFYFYGPMAIIITINIVLFSITAFKIRTIKKDTSMLKKEDSKRHSYENDKQTFNLYLKLLFAMGVNWSMEIISWVVIWKIEDAPDAIWYLTDFCNAIYGVFIFFIFVFKRSIWKLLKKRYYSFIGKPHLAHSMTMTNTTRVTSYSTTNSSVHDNPHAVNDTNTLTSEA